MPDAHFAGRFEQILNLLRLFGADLGRPTELSNMSLADIPSIFAGYDIEAGLKRCELAWRQNRQPQIVAAAVAIIGLYSSAIPQWLAVAVFQIIEKTISPKDRKKRRDLVIHFVRSLAVLELRKAGNSWESSFAEASEALKKTPLRGSADTMRASHGLAQRELKEARGEQLKLWFNGISAKGLTKLEPLDVFPKRQR